MPWVPRPPPTPERQTEKNREHAVGMFQKAAYDAQEAEREVQERKNAIPSVRSERWLRRKDATGVRPPGRRAVEICRNAKGKFSRLLTPAEMAEHFKLTLGRDVPSPKQKLRS